MGLGSWFVTDGTDSIGGFASEADAKMYLDNHEGMENYGVTQLKDPWPEVKTPERYHPNASREIRDDMTELILFDESGLPCTSTRRGFMMVYNHRDKKAGVIIPTVLKGADEPNLRMKSLSDAEIVPLLSKALLAHQSLIESKDEKIEELKFSLWTKGEEGE